MENVKDWLDKKGYHNSGLRTDRNHRIDLYLSDVLDEYRTEQLRLGAVVGQSEQLLAFYKWYQQRGRMWRGETGEEVVKDFLSQ